MLLVGLGNPGAEYAKTRHNIGFMAVDEIVRRYDFPEFKPKGKGVLTSAVMENEKILILKPHTFMNLSGEAVLGLCSFYKLTPKDIIVFHDDMDLPVGKVKVKRGGGNGGHNGLKSIDSHIGPDYLRVRVGIGRPDGKADVVNWVLGAFNTEDSTAITEIIHKIAEYLPLLLRGDDQTFMNRINQK